jgi:hypothetical protein
MSYPARISLVALFLLLIGAGLWLGPDGREATRTSFGHVPEGYGALLDWLAGLGLPSARSYVGPAGVPKTQTLWWLDPRIDCDGEALAAWVEGGGTVLIAPGAAVDGEACRPLAELALPARSLAESAPEAGAPLRVTGPLVAQPRSLACGKLATFAPAMDWETLASLDERPFVLQRRLGAGRVLLVADAGFLENRCFDKADAAPLAGDLVGRLGAPWLDERIHGLRPSRGTVATLIRSPALAFFLGMALLGLLHVWRGLAVPPRRLEDPLTPAPSLDAFVDSLAALYAATGDHRRVGERYRELTLSRLRRVLGLAPSAGAEPLRERLARRPGVSPANLDVLTSTHPITSRGALEREAAALDAVVEEARR